MSLNKGLLARPFKKGKNMIKFFVEVKNELVKVVWPTKTQTLQYTLVVIVFSLVVSLILAAFDFGLFRLFEKIV